jgi:hypothetical protein
MTKNTASGSLPNVSSAAVVVGLGPGPVLVGHGQDHVGLLVGVVGRVVDVHVVIWKTKIAGIKR